MTPILDKDKAAEMGKMFADTVKDARETVTERLEDGRVAMNRLVKQGRRTMEDVMDDTARQVKRNPLGAVAVAFGAGFALAALLLGVGYGRRRS